MKAETEQKVAKATSELIQTLAGCDDQEKMRVVLSIIQFFGIDEHVAGHFMRLSQM